MPAAPRPPRSQITVRADLVLWLNDEAERRVCGRGLMIDRAVELLREATVSAPDLVNLPPAPTP